MKTYTYRLHPYFTIPDKVIIVRHGESEGNILDDDGVANHDKPSHDFDLSGTGIIQALAVGQVLKREFPDRLEFDVIAHSTYKRAWKTCEIALGESRHGTVFPTVSDSRLNEKDEGIRHKLTKDDITKHYPLAPRLFKKYGRYHHVPIHGESVPQVEMRIRDLMRDLVYNKRQKVLFFGHGVWMRIFHHMVSMGDHTTYEDRDILPHPKNGAIYYFVKLSNCVQFSIMDDHITV